MRHLASPPFGRSAAGSGAKRQRDSLAQCSLETDSTCFRSMIRYLSTDELIARAREVYARGAYDDALDHLEHAVWREPGFADVHHLRGLCYVRLGRLHEALEAFSRAVKINARYAEAQVNRARVLTDLGRHEEAGQVRAEVGSLLEQKPADRYPPSFAARLANQHRDLGVLYADSGFLREASEQFRCAVEICPGFADVRNDLGRVLMDLGLDEAAVREFRAALEINPSYLEARVNLGLGLFRIAAFEEAERQWRRCLEQDPAHPGAQAYLEKLRPGEASDRVWHAAVA
jgi:tetratricopeptide (TPR) repeat protein